MLNYSRTTFNFASILAIFALSFGCSTGAKKQNSLSPESKNISKGTNSENSEINFEQAYEAAEKRLETVVAEARKAGPKAVKYLSTNLFLKANEASKAGDYNSSALIYKFVLDLIPDDPYVALKYSVDLIRTGKVSDALQLLETFYSKSGEYREQYGMLIAGVHTSFQHFEKAEKVYKGLVNNYPNNAEACVFLAKSYADYPANPVTKDEKQLSKKRFNKAVNLLNSCEKKNPESGVYSYYRGKIYLKNEKIDLAMKAFKKSLKLEPVFYQSAVGLGIIYEDQGKLKDAEKVYEDLLSKWSSNRVILSRIVQNLLAQEKYDKVIAYAEQLVNLDSSDLNLKVKLGILYTDQGNYDRAIEVFESIIKEVPESDKVLYYLGAIHQEIGSYQKSIEYFTRIEPESVLYFDSSIQITTMLTSLALGKVDSGVSRNPSSEKVAQYENQLFDFVSTRGQVNKKLYVELNVLKGQYFEFQNNLKETIDILESVSHEEEFSDSQRYYLATIYDRANYYKESIREAKKIIENDPKNAHAYNFIGYSYLERSENFDLAFEFISKAIEINPEDAYIRDSLGWYYFKVGQFDNSLQELKKAFSLVDNDRVIVQHLGQVYLALRKYARAKVFFEKALKLTTTDKERQELKDAIKGMEDKINLSFDEPKRLPANNPSE